MVPWGTPSLVKTKDEQTYRRLRAAVYHLRNKVHIEIHTELEIHIEVHTELHLISYLQFNI